MILVSYDIQNDKLRAKFAKFILKFGERKQYSVYEIKNSQRILSLIKSELDFNFAKKFGEEDSVLIIETSKTCKVSRYGFAKHDDSDIIVI
jgi:CRISPR-associated endoribonuclease cas2